LAIGVDIEIESDTARVTELVDLGYKTLVLGCVASCYALVGLGARACGSTASDLPLLGPVAFDVAANARVSRHGLAVLAPETVGGLTVDKAIRVDDGGNVEVELVHDCLDGSIRGILGEELPGKVLGSDTCDPLTGVLSKLERR
jgi:hypothetical protein